MKQLEFDSMDKAEEFAEILEGANLQAKCVCDVLKIATRDLKKKGESLLPAAALVQIIVSAGQALERFGLDLADTIPAEEKKALSLTVFDFAEKNVNDSISEKAIEQDKRLRVIGE